MWFCKAEREALGFGGRRSATRIKHRMAYGSACVCVCARVCAPARARARACVGACVRAYIVDSDKDLIFLGLRFHTVRLLALDLCLW